MLENSLFNLTSSFSSSDPDDLPSSVGNLIIIVTLAKKPILILQLNSPYINGLLTEREVCTVKYQTEDFQYGPSDEGARSMPKTARSDISQYTPNKRGQ